ncbi:MAG: flavodoxin domain-containing protein [Deltaproteobacteria bacterium]|nr:flavodoxin domain-containing protein [Deltaproteobacteria bacterium]
MSKVAENPTKCAIIYFSQTGNTKKVAEAICRGIRSASGQCDLLRIQDADIRNLTAYDLIGLGSPVFVFKPPINVSIFMSRMSALRGKPCFIFATHGGHPGNFMPAAAKILGRQGLVVIGTFDCDGDVTRPFYPYPFWTGGHPDEIDLEMVANFGKEMIERSQRISLGEQVPLPQFEWLKDSLYYRSVKVWDANKIRSKEFIVAMTLDRMKCTYPECHLCVDHCPMQAINLSVTPVVFRKGCISCLFCEKICPTGAIEINGDFIEKRWKIAAEGFKERGYPEFFQRAKTELIGNRSTLFRKLNEVDLNDPAKIYNRVRFQRPRFIIS